MAFDLIPTEPRWLDPLRAACHGIALVAVLLSQLPWPLRAAVAGAVLICALAPMLRRSDRVARLTARTGQWEIHEQAGRKTTLLPPRRGFVSPGLIIVPYPGRRGTSWLRWAPSGTGAQAHRRVRAELRLGHGA